MGPNDAWVAECSPCRWQELYETQDSAIRAAEIHVMHFHADVHPDIRGRDRMGHVQLRTITPATPYFPPAPAPAPSGTDATGSALSGASSAAPEQHTTIDITTREGEVIEVKE